MPIIVSEPRSDVWRAEPATLTSPVVDAALHMVLLAELKHPIRSDLRTPLGCIELERQRASEAQTTQVLDNLLGCPLCLTSISDLLHIGSRTSADLGEYLLLLCSRISAGKDLERSHITLAAYVVSLPTTLDQAVIVGMIVNELTTNSIKRAFKHGVGGRIAVRLQLAQSNPELVVSDNDWRDLEADIRGYGLCLVHCLAAQADGNLMCKYTGGTVWRLIFNSAWAASPATI